MTTDVVMCFYRQEPLWPLVCWGLDKNKGHINRVILVNDELWDKNTRYAIETAVNGRFPLVLLDHEHDGFGGHKCFNQGAREVETDYFVHLDGDVVLAEGSLAANLRDVDENVLLAGLSHDCPRSLTLAALEAGPSILRRDRRPSINYPPSLKFEMCRDLYLCCKTENYLALGGHDEGYKGYGWLDYDWGIRWMMRFGLDSLELGMGDSYHLSDLVKSPLPSHDSTTRFIERRTEWLKWIENRT